MYRTLCRQEIRKEYIRRDELIFSILSSNPAGLYSAMRNAKSSGIPSISNLLCNGVLYPQEMVADGFFHSLSLLKDPPASNFPSETENFIIAIAEAGPQIPFLSPKDTEDILSSLRPNVTDLCSLSIKHFLNLGDLGILLFSELLINSKLVFQNTGFYGHFYNPVSTGFFSLNL